MIQKQDRRGIESRIPLPRARTGNTRVPRKTLTTHTEAKESCACSMMAPPRLALAARATLAEG